MIDVEELKSLIVITKETSDQNFKRVLLSELNYLRIDIMKLIIEIELN